MPKLAPTASKKAKRTRVHAEMHKFKHGTLKSSNGKKVTDREQAIAIAMSESGQSRRGRRSKSRRRTGK